MHVNTLFPSRRNDNDEVKGGIILLKLSKKNNSDNGKITLEVTYRDVSNEKHESNQTVVFEERENEYYDNTGIRKGIVLTRYANLLKDWILYERSSGKKEFLITENTGIFDVGYTEGKITRILGEHERTSVKLTVSDKYKELFKQMKDYIEVEKEVLRDDDLKQEIDILDKLIAERNTTNYEKENWFFDF